MKKEKYYYFDNATTSFPKPKEVINALDYFIKNIGGTYGRVDTKRGHITTSMIEECRVELKKLFEIKNESNIVFSSGATRAINDILNGLDLDGGEVLISTLEHNAALRPIHIRAKEKLIKYKIMPSLKDGTIDLDKLKKSINKKTKLAVVNMQSNISGVIQPIESIKKILEDIPILVDATQAAGIHEIKAEKWNIDYLAFTSHKGLLGITGSGGFYVKEPKTLKATQYGGGYGDGFETPYSMPEIFEVGTPSTVSIVGLLHALKNRPNWNIDKNDLKNTIEEIKNIKDKNNNEIYKVLSADNADNQGFVFSIVPKKIEISSFAYTLYSKYNIECRYGFHCAGLAHNFYGNEKGAIRFSFSPYTKKSDLKYLIQVLASMKYE